MNTRKLVPAVAAVMLLTAGFVAGQISAKYPHMRAAQKFGKQAYAELNMVEHNHGPLVDKYVNEAKADLDDANKKLEMAAAEAEKTGK